MDHSPIEYDGLNIAQSAIILESTN